MQTFDCPKCGAPVSYEPGVPGSTTRCAYCNSQLAVPDHLRGQPARVIGQFEVHVGPQVSSGATKWIWFLVLVPIVIVVINFAGVFGGLVLALRSVGYIKENNHGNISNESYGLRSRENPSEVVSVILLFGEDG